MLYDGGNKRLMNKERINSELAKQLSRIFSYELNDPRIGGMLTVLEVQTSDDLSHARVYVSYFGDPTKEKSTFEALENCTGHIRNLLKQRVKMRNIPFLRIIKDNSLDHALDITSAIERAMESTHANEEKGYGDEDGDQ